MFRFSIREMMLVTAMFGLGLGWFLDHRAQAADAALYKDNSRYLRESIESLDRVLTLMGFEIKQEENGKSYKPPPCLRDWPVSTASSPPPTSRQ